MHVPIGRSAPEEPEEPARPEYRYDHADWLDATSFDWIEQPLAAISDAFFDLITLHHDAVRHSRAAAGDRTEPR
jgi:hypothetical protein